jgi:hypothetical protein
LLSLIYSRRIDNSIDQLRADLSLFLLSSTSYRPDRLLALLPEDALLQERTILLSRLKRHLEALVILVDRLGDILAARKYCERHYKPLGHVITPTTTCDQVYLFLVELMLKAELEGRIDIQEVLSVLDDYGPLINGAKVLDVFKQALF